MQVLAISGSVLETVFKQWDPQGIVQCNSHLNSSHPVYIVQTTGGDTHIRTTHKVTFCLSFFLFVSHIFLSLVV